MTAVNHQAGHEQVALDLFAYAFSKGRQWGGHGVQVIAHQMPKKIVGSVSSLWEFTKRNTPQKVGEAIAQMRADMIIIYMSPADFQKECFQKKVDDVSSEQASAGSNEASTARVEESQEQKVQGVRVGDLHSAAKRVLVIAITLGTIVTGWILTALVTSKTCSSRQ